MNYLIAMKLLLDQGLTLSAAALLRDAGIDTIHVRDIGMPETEDAEIIQRARDEKRAVATLDADFHPLLALDEAISPSVIRIRIEMSGEIVLDTSTAVRFLNGDAIITERVLTLRK